MIRDFLLMVNTNCGHIAYHLRDIIVCRGWKSPVFANCILILDPQQRNTQQCQRNLYITEKYI